MTITREVMVLALTPAEAKAMVESESWGPDTTVMWVGEPKAVMALGLSEGYALYAIRVIFRWTR